MVVPECGGGCGAPALFIVFVGVLIFMIGDGAGSNYLLTVPGSHRMRLGVGRRHHHFLYGKSISIGSGLLGAISGVLGPRVVMLIGALNGGGFAAIFLASALGPVSDGYDRRVGHSQHRLPVLRLHHPVLAWIRQATPAHFSEVAGASPK